MATSVSAFAAQPTPDQALGRLVSGNDAFVADKPLASDLSRERRLALAEGQQPFATLVGCSDSRVGPEQLFGAGLGELFIVRTAGNNVDTAGMGSIEYSVAVLKVPLIVVLGHEKMRSRRRSSRRRDEGRSVPWKHCPHDRADRSRRIGRKAQGW